MKQSWLLLPIIVLVVSISFAGQNQLTASIAVAANCKPAMDAIITLYETQHSGCKLLVTYGASGKMYGQILSGAPFDIFFSADMHYPALLAQRGFALSEVRCYTIGRIALWSRTVDPSSGQLPDVLGVCTGKIAIANPRHAPYGERAVECLNYYGVFSMVQGRLVYGENSAQAAQFAASGAADIGIVAYSECLAPAMKQAGGKYRIIPKESHSPLRQGCIVLKHALGNPVATNFFEFVFYESSVRIFVDSGFSEVDSR